MISRTPPNIATNPPDPLNQNRFETFINRKSIKDLIPTKEQKVLENISKKSNKRLLKIVMKKAPPVTLALAIIIIGPSNIIESTFERSIQIPEHTLQEFINRIYNLE